MTDTALYAAADRSFARKRLIAFAIPAVILLYLAYVFLAFDIPGLAQRARLDNAQTLMADIYSDKTHVTRDNRSGGIDIAIEGERKGAYAEGTSPDWVTPEGEATRVDLGEGQHILLLPEN